MALLAEKGVDLKKLSMKKMAKKAKKKTKSKRLADAWEGVEVSEESGEEGVAELEGESSGGDNPAQVCCRGHNHPFA